MSKIEAFRKIIREEMRKVIKEELSSMVSILNESKTSSTYSETFKSKKTNDIPLTLNKQTPKVAHPITGNSMLNTLLSETAMNMQSSEEMHFTSHDVDGFSLMSRASEESDRVGSVNGMLASSRPSGVHEMVQINEVPDFSELMNKMMSKGTI